MNNPQQIKILDKSVNPPKYKEGDEIYVHIGNSDIVKYWIFGRRCLYDQNRWEYDLINEIDSNSVYESSIIELF